MGGWGGLRRPRAGTLILICLSVVGCVFGIWSGCLVGRADDGLLLMFRVVVGAGGEVTRGGGYGPSFRGGSVHADGTPIVRLHLFVTTKSGCPSSSDLAPSSIGDWGGGRWIQRNVPAFAARERRGGGSAQDDSFGDGWSESADRQLVGRVRGGVGEGRGRSGGRMGRGGKREAGWGRVVCNRGAKGSGTPHLRVERGCLAVVEGIVRGIGSASDTLVCVVY